jgi:hypothetical protein
MHHCLWQHNMYCAKSLRTQIPSRIADVQRSIVSTRKLKDQGPGTGAAITASHTCRNVFDPEKPKDRHGFCASFLWPYNDVHFILQFEPRAVAFFLRDYEALCEAEKSLSPERFQKLYAAKKRLIELDYLPQIGEDLLREASELAAALPHHPVIVEMM